MKKSVRWTNDKKNCKKKVRRKNFLNPSFLASASLVHHFYFSIQLPLAGTPSARFTKAGSDGSGRGEEGGNVEDGVFGKVAGMRRRRILVVWVYGRYCWKEGLKTDGI